MSIAHQLAHLFIPHHSNNHKARVLHPSILALISIGLIAIQFGFGLFSKVSPSVLGYAANISVSEVIKLTNAKRAEAGLPPLKENSALTVGAQAKGKYMLEKDFWAHVAPDGTQPWKFFGDVGYKYRYAGENLARDFSNPNSAIDAWMASPTHRENMLSPKYKEIGIGVVEGDLGGVDTTIIVQFFGTALGDTIPVQPVAAAETASETPAPVLATPAPTPGSLLTGTKEQTSSTQSPVLISPFVTTRGLSLGLIGLLLVVMAVDIVVVSRRKISRIGGRSHAHLAFLGMILAIILIVQAGRVL